MRMVMSLIRDVFSATKAQAAATQGDPRGAPDVVCDARELQNLPGGVYDAIYCSHNLEHYYRHDGARVVRGFAHMLNDTGFAEIRVPDIAQVVAALHDRQLDLDDVLYESSAGPISAHDVVYACRRRTLKLCAGLQVRAHKRSVRLA
ncbi:MAG: hypothetical protein H0X13_10985 [Ramlibacter sp.]|nr:hypothetical protein [Ramlibacter sp.]